MSRLIHATELLKHGKTYFSNLKTKSNSTSLNTMRQSIALLISVMCFINKCYYYA